MNKKIITLTLLSSLFLIITIPDAKSEQVTIKELGTPPDSSPHDITDTSHDHSDQATCITITADKKWSRTNKCDMY